MRNYDSIAWFYDRLSKLVFGRALINAQLYLISAIPANAKILIAGGGTGWVLDEITKLHPSGLAITYIDASAKMIAQAGKRNIGDNRVEFVASPIEQFFTHDVYDVVLTPFLLDNFTDAAALSTCAHIGKMLLPHGKWLYCDFLDTEVWWQRATLRIMYLFFRVSCGIEAKHLPDVAAYFSTHNYIITGQRAFFKNFVISRVYEKA